MKPRPSILVVEPPGDAHRSLLAFLAAHEFDPVAARDGETALNVLAARPVDCLLAEWRPPHHEARLQLRRARELHPDLCAVVIAEAGDREAAVEALREGAHAVLARPLNFEQVLEVLRRGLEHRALAERARELEERLDERLALDRIAGSSPAIRRVMQQVRSIAATRSTVLIEGEPGTGKGFIALAIHRNSPRRHGRFVEVACDALAEGLLEGELFGHEPGAVTGASVLHRGRFEQADGGTLFLDEIGDLTPALQVRLVRVLQDRALERLGGTGPVRVDVRLIAATRRDLAADVAAGRFREDLLFRLNVVHVRVPALRERREDIPLLVRAFIAESNLEHGRKATGVTRGVLEQLARHAWPGNVRELKTTVAGMVAGLERSRPLDLSDLPETLRRAGAEAGALEVTVGMTVAEAERQLIEATLAHMKGDKPRAASMLGIGLRTLYRKIHQYGLR